MIQLADNLGYLGPKPNFDRDYFLTCELMRLVTDSQIDDGHISYCAETKTHYEYLYSNTIDSRLGKWREFKPIDVSLNPDSINSVQNKTLYQIFEGINKKFIALKTELDSIDLEMDGKLDEESSKGVQNKVITAQFDFLGKEIASISNSFRDYVAKNEVLGNVDQESELPIQSKVLYPILTKLQEDVERLVIEVGKMYPLDTKLSPSSTRPVENKAIYAEIRSLTSEVNDIKSILYYSSPIIIDFTADPIIIPLLVETTITLRWSCFRIGEDVTKDCKIYINDEEWKEDTNEMIIILTPETEEKYSYTLKVIYEENEYTESLEITAMPPSYYGTWNMGEEKSPTAADITNLPEYWRDTKELEANGLYINHESFIYAYPSSLGVINSIKDGNGFEYLWSEGGFSHVTRTIKEIPYEVYFLNTPCKLSEFKFIFQ